jgi:hypothetical protein
VLNRHLRCTGGAEETSPASLASLSLGNLARGAVLGNFRKPLEELEAIDVDIYHKTRSEIE